MKKIYFFLLGALLLFSSCAGLLQSGKVIDDVYYIPSSPTNSKSYTTLLERSSISRLQRAVVKDSTGAVDYFDETYSNLRGGTSSSRSYAENLDSYASSGYNSSYLLPQMGLSYGFGRYYNSYPYSYSPYDMSMYNSGYYGYNGYNSYSPYYNNMYSRYYSNGPLNPYYSNYNTVSTSSSNASVRPYSTSGSSSSTISDGARVTYGRRVSISSNQLVLNSGSSSSVDNQKRKSTVVSNQSVSTTRFARPIVGYTNSTSNVTSSSSNSNYNSSYSRPNNQSTVSYPTQSRSSSSSTSSSNSSNFNRSNSFNSSSSGGGSRTGSGRR